MLSIQGGEYPSCHAQVTRGDFGAGARPAVFALSNPGEVAECSAQAAHDWSGGAAVYASGTAFPPVARPDGSTVVPAQCNNCLVFPGIPPCASFFSIGCWPCHAPADVADLQTVFRARYRGHACMCKAYA